MVQIKAKVEVVIEACIDADFDILHQSLLEDKVKHIIENEIDNVLRERVASNYVEAKSKVVELKILERGNE